MYCSIRFVLRLRGIDVESRQAKPKLVNTVRSFPAGAISCVKVLHDELAQLGIFDRIRPLLLVHSLLRPALPGSRA